MCERSGLSALSGLFMNHPECYEECVCVSDFLCLCINVYMSLECSEMGSTHQRAPTATLMHTHTHTHRTALVNITGRVCSWLHGWLDQIIQCIPLPSKTEHTAQKYPGEMYCHPTDTHTHTRTHTRTQTNTMSLLRCWLHEARGTNNESQLG